MPRFRIGELENLRKQARPSRGTAAPRFRTRTRVGMSRSQRFRHIAASGSIETAARTASSD